MCSEHKRVLDTPSIRAVACANRSVLMDESIEMTG
jgi:hypothetical protein